MYFKILKVALSLLGSMECGWMGGWMGGQAPYNAIAPYSAGAKMGSETGMYVSPTQDWYASVTKPKVGSNPWQ